VAAHASLFAASGARGAPVASDVSSAVEVSVEAAPPDPVPVPAPERPEAPPASPRTPSSRPRVAPLRTDGIARPKGGEPPKPETPAEPEAAPTLPRFALSLPSAGPGGAIGRSSVATADREPTAGADVLGEREVDVPARLRWSETPRYPPEALADEIEGDVQLELVVSTAGNVESVQVLRPAGHRFDEAAMASARRLRFLPAVKSGRPVRVRLVWTVGFRLR